MLEAMSMGAIPIQTNSSCAEEWITDQKTGLLVTPNDVEAITAAILKVVRGQFDVNRARLENYDVIDKRYNPRKLSIIATGYYEKFVIQNSK
jgi:glycosyltransferase involved in cell wall biosynthesis